MRWQNRRKSTNVEDRRGLRGRGAKVGGGLGAVILEEGDIEEGINAAAAVGDDRLQKRSQGYVVPDSFTHGTSKQRAYWFVKGLKSGDLRQGNTFDAGDL